VLQHHAHGCVKASRVGAARMLLEDVLRELSSYPPEVLIQPELKHQHKAQDEQIRFDEQVCVCWHGVAVVNGGSLLPSIATHDEL
jgi:hypothetical protein